ncbi:hypothetical protein [Streptomyces griseosporeus]|uniref:hypothetical protein n=1 Tax=Streptomyces griseosporeus TaxID=1910 RepID=UPI00167DBA99|nr:hypothetical protein [Streptomyces griseosporeus]GHF54095.1 hypothetical protein GCM10018783_23770 [Streptomyces griseosporeus]
MNLRPTAGLLASCALAVATLTACGAHEPATSPTAAAPPPAAASSPADARPPGAAGTADTAGTAGPARATVTATAPAPARPAGTRAAAPLPPRPDAHGEAAYVRALTAIDPDIVHDDEDGAVDRGRAQCRTIQAFPGDTDRQVAEAERRFTSPGHPEGFGRAKAARIVDAVHTQLCPAF